MVSTSSPALRPTQPPTWWALGATWGGKGNWSMVLTTSPLSHVKVKETVGALSQTPVYGTQVLIF